MVTTLDAKAGEIVLAVAPGCESVAREVMIDLGRTARIEQSRPREMSYIREDE